MKALKLLGYIWAAPCTLVGFVLSLFMVPVGWPLWSRGTLVIRANRILPPMAVAQTWGWLVIYRPGAEVSAWRHEQAHVRQYMILGPLFFPAYGLASFVSWMKGTGWYKGNWFEVDARRRARWGT